MVDKQTGICNRALLLLGASRISSLDEQSTEAITCNEFYEPSYRALLNIFAWKFAQKYKDLAIIATTTPGDPQYLYAFKLPTDLIWLQHTLPNQNSYKVIGDELHAKQKEIKIKYTWRVGEDYLPALFEQTFAFYLAQEGMARQRLNYCTSLNQ